MNLHAASRTPFLGRLALEEAGVDRIEARVVDRKPAQRAVGRHHRARRLRPHVAVGGQPIVVAPDPLHRLTPGIAPSRASRSVSGARLRLDLDDEAGAEHLPREFRDRAHQHDAAALEQRDAVADALHLIEQMRRQQHRDALVLEALDHLQELEGRLRIETGGRLVENGDLGLLHQDFGKPEPLAHAARKRRDPLVGDVGEPHARERRGDAAAPAPAGMPIRRAV